MQPNFLIIMSDEHGPMFSGTYGHPIVKTPNMGKLADLNWYVVDKTICQLSLNSTYDNFIEWFLR